MKPCLRIDRQMDGKVSACYTISVMLGPPTPTPTPTPTANPTPNGATVPADAAVRIRVRVRVRVSSLISTPGKPKAG